jgi:hypothetical protein
MRSTTSRNDRRTLHRNASLRALPLLALTILTLFGAASSAQTRVGDLSPKLVNRTNDRYGHDCFWQGPRGLPYSSLPNATPIQKANLYPDGKGTYWIANFDGIPEGTEITLAGIFPHARYMSFGIVTVDPTTGAAVSTSEHFGDRLITPYKKSENPFLPGAQRDTKNGKRKYEITLLAEDPPSDPAQRRANTLYLGADGSGALVYRVVLPDIGLDGAAGVKLPVAKAILPGSGKKLKRKRLCEQLISPLTQGTPPGVSLAQWLSLRSLPYANLPLNDPATMPAHDPSVWEKFWNGTYSFAGLFFPPAVRATFPTGNLDFGANADTTFLTSFVNRQFGPVYVLRGKMPTFPDTYLGAKTMEASQVRYWSISQNDAPPSGKTYESVADFQIPRDADGNYTIVVSRPEDRPTNATDSCGVAWMDWGTAGEGLADPNNRPDFGLLIMRFEFESSDFANAGIYVAAPGQEAQVMGDYFPAGEYMSAAQFEAIGCPAQ